MANSELLNKNFTIPEELFNKLRQSNATILNNRSVTYQNIKKAKHDLENGNVQVDDGVKNDVLNWANGVLNTSRDNIHTSKEINRDMLNRDNQFRKSHTNKYRFNNIMKITESQFKSLINILIDNGRKRD